MSVRQLYPSSSSGGVTSISNSDGTLLFTPASGAVVGSLVLSHANTWTAKPTIQLTTEQLRVGYDVNNYWKTTIDSAGNANLDLVGTNPAWSFPDPVAFGKTWDEGGLELRYASVPTLIIDSSTTIKQTNFELRQGNAQRYAHYVPANSIDYRIFNYQIGADNLIINGNTGDISNSLGHIKTTLAGKGFYLKEGTNAMMGTGTLSGGTATISTTAVAANSRIFLTDTGGGANIGSLTAGTITAGTSFVVNSTNVLDSSTFNWIIFQPA